MKYLSEFREASKTKLFIEKTKSIAREKWTIMEVCGSQTHSILSSGIDELLPPNITLVHGPGCPVCVTPKEIIDTAILLSKKKDTILFTYGDMLRVPGSKESLFKAKGDGAKIKMVYSPFEVIEFAKNNQEKKCVFLGIGFETTTPSHASVILKARELNLKNFFVLLSQFRVPPALEAILKDPFNKIQGFLAPGHVCTVMGIEEYIPISEKYKVPIVVTGFESVDLAEGIFMLIQMLERSENAVKIQYKRSCKPEGNLKAKEIMKKVFKIGPQKWRGIGLIPDSGWILREEFREFDALNLLKEKIEEIEETKEGCIAALILQGKKKPFECSLFGKDCTPLNPLGAPMVSSEGACAAYYKYKKIAD
ncbi:MAG: hydrogenase formation protein HypD [candidate division WOR-3 bacterium]